MTLHHFISNIFVTFCFRFSLNRKMNQAKIITRKRKIEGRILPRSHQKLLPLQVKETLQQFISCTIGLYMTSRGVVWCGWRWMASTRFFVWNDLLCTLYACLWPCKGLASTHFLWLYDDIEVNAKRLLPTSTFVQLHVSNPHFLFFAFDAQFKNELNSKPVKVLLTSLVKH